MKWDFDSRYTLAVKVNAQGDITQPKEKLEKIILGRQRGQNEKVEKKIF